MVSSAENVDDLVFSAQAMGRGVRAENRGFGDDVLPHTHGAIPSLVSIDGRDAIAPWSFG